MICPTCHQETPRLAADTITAHLYVTDVDRMLPLRGDTDIQRAANHADDVRAARQERLRAVLTDFCERANASRPPFADERAIDRRGDLGRPPPGQDAGGRTSGRRGRRSST